MAMYMCVSMYKKQLLFFGDPFHQLDKDFLC